MSARLLLLLLIPLAYLLGSVPFGLLVGWSRGIDVRKAGSGNIGATNVGRLLGPCYFALAFSLDLFKGLGPMLLAAWVVACMSPNQRNSAVFGLWIAVGAAAVLGHIASPFLGFRGGKGVATAAGAALGLLPYLTLPALAAIAVFLILLRITRYVSASSIGAAIAFPLLYIAIGLPLGWPVFGNQWPLLVFSAGVCVMVIVRHRANIARLIAGTENRVGSASPPATLRPSRPPPDVSQH